MVGGLRFARKFAGAPFSISSVRKQLLRQRCDARGFKPLQIEIIAKQKVAPAFEPQKVSGRRPQHPSAMLWMPQVQPRCRAALVFNIRLAAIIRFRMSSDRRASRIAI